MTPTSPPTPVAAAAAAEPLWSWRRIARFVGTGVGNTLFGYAVFCALYASGLHYAVATLGSQVAGLLFNYLTFGAFVFSDRRSRGLPAFALVYLSTYLFTVAGLAVLESFGVSPYLGVWLILGPNVALVYLLNGLFVFVEAGPEA